MLRTMTERSVRWLTEGPIVTLALPLLTAAVLMLTACGTSVGQCVATYEFEGEVRKDGYTQQECEDECSIIGRTLSCYFDPRVSDPMEVSARREFGSN
jgi:hypothetical protein